MNKIVVLLLAVMAVAIPTDEANNKEINDDLQTSPTKFKGLERKINKLFKVNIYISK